MEQVLYKLPDGWEWKSLGDLVEFKNGYAFKSNVFSDSGIPVLRISNIQSGGISDRNMAYIPSEKLDVKAADFYVEPGDIVIAMSGATTGKVATNNTEDRLLQNQRVGRFIITNKIFRKYVLYYLGNKVEENLQKSLGAAQPNLSTAQIKEIKIPIQPANEQKRIVEKLDVLLTRIDTAIEHLQESVTLADALYASELNEVFPSDADIESLTDKDGWVSLSDTCTFENGDRGKNYPSKSAFVAEGIPVVSAGNLGERYIDHKGLNYITPERYDLLRSGRIRIGDILFCLRGSLGKVAISKDIDEGVIASSLVIIRPKDRVSAEYIYKYLKSSLCQKFISYYNNGAAQPNLSAKSLGKFMLPLPNAEHQKLIVDGLDEKYQLNQKLLDGLNSKIISLQSLKASILDSAFKGEL